MVATRQISGAVIQPWGKWVPIASADPSAATTVDFTGLSGYRALRISLHGVQPATGGTDLVLRTSTDNGLTFDASASDYTYAGNYAVTGSSNAVTGSTGAAQLLIVGGLGSAANRIASGRVELFNFNQAAYCEVVTNTIHFDNSGNLTSVRIGGARLQATARSAIRLLMVSGNIARGHIELEGMA